MGDRPLRPGHLTIGLPVRNGEAYLASAVENLLASQIEELTIIISDNASSDGTPDIAEALHRHDPRVILHRQPSDVGANTNFNDVFRLCTSELFKWAAVDDLCEPAMLRSCIEALADPSVVLAHGRARLIDTDGNVLAQAVSTRAVAEDHDAAGRFRDVLENEVWCTPVFGVVRTAALRRTALLRGFYGADKVLLAELSLAGRFVEVDAAFFRRCHERQSTVLDARAKARWTTGRSRRTYVPAAARAAAAFMQLALGPHLPPRQRVAAAGAVARLTVRPDKLRKLVLPGPYNYFGWGGRSTRHAYAALDLTPVGVRVGVRGMERSAPATELTAPTEPEPSR